MAIGDNAPIAVKVITTITHDHLNATQPGRVTIDGNRLLVDCSDSQIEIAVLQPSGKRPMGAADFLRGLSRRSLLIVP